MVTRILDTCEVDICTFLHGQSYAIFLLGMINNSGVIVVMLFVNKRCHFEAGSTVALIADDGFVLKLESKVTTFAGEGPFDSVGFVNAGASRDVVFYER